MTQEEFMTLKKGDTVYLPKKCPHMATSWVDVMDNYIGKPLKVVHVDYNTLTCRAYYNGDDSFLYTADAVEFMSEVRKRVVIGQTIFKVSYKLPPSLPLEDKIKNLKFYLKLKEEYKRYRENPEEFVIYAYHHKQKLLAPLIANGIIIKED